VPLFCICLVCRARIGDRLGYHGIYILGSTLIQLLIGNYLEPRLFGSILDILAYLSVFAVFFWASLWGVPGAFIGVPVTIALLTCREAYPRRAGLPCSCRGGQQECTCNQVPAQEFRPLSAAFQGLWGYSRLSP
jgi:AI-2E family transporter